MIFGFGGGGGGGNSGNNGPVAVGNANAYGHGHGHTHDKRYHTSMNGSGSGGKASYPAEVLSPHGYHDRDNIPGYRGSYFEVQPHRRHSHQQHHSHKRPSPPSSSRRRGSYQDENVNVGQRPQLSRRSHTVDPRHYLDRRSSHSTPPPVKHRQHEVPTPESYEPSSKGWFFRRSSSPTPTLNGLPSAREEPPPPKDELPAYAKKEQQYAPGFPSHEFETDINEYMMDYPPPRRVPQRHQYRQAQPPMAHPTPRHYHHHQHQNQHQPPLRYYEGPFPPHPNAIPGRMPTPPQAANFGPPPPYKSRRPSREYDPNAGDMFSINWFRKWRY